MVKKKNLVFDKTQPIKLDLACGDNKLAGFFGIDKFKTDSTDAVFDLTIEPWPIDTESVDALNCSHFFEHLHGHQRVAFMEECWRVLKPGGQLVIIVPHWSSMRSVQDFTHQWPPVCETSFLYFNKDWRVTNKLTHGHYDINCNFNYSYGYSIDQEVSVRNQEYQLFAIKHYNNSVNDLYVTLTKIATL